MRTEFIETLCEIAKIDSRIWLLCGDLGYSVLENFSTNFPDRFVNVGVAEQNMVGLAAGLALSGKIVFIYSIVNFPIMRCFEQIRNDICYHNLNVNIVTVGGGLTYGSLGYSHHGIEDLAVMRVLPNMTVIAPGDPVETKLATRAIAAHQGPCYLRLGKTGEPILHKKEPKFQIGRAIEVYSGEDLTLISTGGVLQLVIEAFERLSSKGYSVQVLSMPTVEPLDEKAILQAAAHTQKIICVEEHGKGGLGSAVAEVLALNEIPIKFRALRLQGETIKVAGSQIALRSRLHLSLEKVIEVAVDL